MKLENDDNRSYTDLKKRIFFVLFILFIYRLGSHVPLPFLDIKNIMNSFSNDSFNIFSLFNLFSGSALTKVTVFSLGIMPYISASIIVQLVISVWEPFKKLKKDGELSNLKIANYTRFLCLFLTIIQSTAMSKYLLSINSQNENIYLLNHFLIILSLISGTMLLIWLGELINEKGIGNGISLIIFSSIVSNIPRTIADIIDKLRQGEINILLTILFLFIILGMIFLIVFVERAQRKILINYAKKQQGRKIYAGQSTYLPIKINISGVIPPIFASSIILFPLTIMQWLDQSFKSEIFYNIRSLLMPGKPIYILLFGTAVIFFCFFYTNIFFNTKETAENLRLSGGFIYGIRPGDQTSFYIKKIVNKVTIIGSFYLSFVCLLPEILIFFTNIPFYFAGTSILIVVLIIIDFISQVQTRLISYRYDNFIRKYNPKNI